MLAMKAQMEALQKKMQNKEKVHNAQCATCLRTLVRWSHASIPPYLNS